jgi:hypothetical protein
MPPGLGVLYRDEFKPTIDNVPVITDGNALLNGCAYDIGAQWHRPQDGVRVRTGQGMMTRWSPATSADSQSIDEKTPTLDSE